MRQLLIYAFVFCRGFPKLNLIPTSLSLWGGQQRGHLLGFFPLWLAHIISSQLENRKTNWSDTNKAGNRYSVISAKLEAKKLIAVDGLLSEKIKPTAPRHGGMGRSSSGLRQAVGGQGCLSQRSARKGRPALFWLSQVEVCRRRSGIGSYHLTW